MKQAPLLALALPAMLLVNVCHARAVSNLDLHFVPVATSEEKPKAEKRPKADEQPQNEESQKEPAVQITVGAGQESYKSGQKVEFTIQLRNACTKPVTLEFPSGQSFDVSATQQGETKPAWRWSEGKAFIQVVRTEILQPGEERVWKASWDQQVQDAEGQNALAPRGVYTVAVDVLANGSLVAPPIEIALTG